MFALLYDNFLILIQMAPYIIEVMGAIAIAATLCFYWIDTKPSKLS